MTAAKRTTTCYIHGCNRAFQDGDKHLEHDIWQNGYFKEGCWYCSLKHLKQANRRDSWLMAAIGLCGTSAFVAAIFIVTPIFDRHFFEVANNTLAFYISFVVCPLGFWATYKLNNL